MQYQRSFEIGERLNLVLDLISTGRFSTPRLAEHLQVSIPTISRDVTALRDLGHEIRAEKYSDGWRYVLVENGNNPHALHTMSGMSAEQGTKAGLK